MKRFFDILLACILIFILLFPLAIIWLCVVLTSEGPGFYKSKRVGFNGKIFIMIKFRTMYLGTPEIETESFKNANKFVTPFGLFLRKSSLDEFPQLWNILLGHMSFVGPRPALYNQFELIKLRKANGVDQILPGLSGWAQINGRDDLSMLDKLNFDIEYLKKRSFFFDLKIIFLTFLKIIEFRGIKH